MCSTNSISHSKEKCLQISDKVAAFKTKLELWRRKVNAGTFVIFHPEAGIIEKSEVEPSFYQLVHDHLLQLSKEFKLYLPIKKDPKTANE